jgi:hypothetical protein
MWFVTTIILYNGGHMISNDDMMELRRIAANTYEQEKSEQIYRIISEINLMQRQISNLKIENAKLKK